MQNSRKPKTAPQTVFDALTGIGSLNPQTFSTTTQTTTPIRKGSSHKPQNASNKSK